MAKGTSLTKEDLVRQVALRLPRYEVNPGEQPAEEWVKSHIDEWMKQSLALAAEPGPNRGQKRTYTYSCRHYRRALQLIRLYGDGRKTTIEKLIRLSDGGAYERARDDVRKMRFATELFAQGDDPEVFNTILGAFRQREFSVFFVVLALRGILNPV